MRHGVDTEIVCIYLPREQVAHCGVQLQGYCKIFFTCLPANCVVAWQPKVLEYRMLLGLSHAFKVL